MSQPNFHNLGKAVRLAGGLCGVWDCSSNSYGGLPIGKSSHRFYRRHLLSSELFGRLNFEDGRRIIALFVV